MISGASERQLQQKIHEARSNQDQQDHVDRLIEQATEEYNTLLVEKPGFCGSGLTSAIYQKLLAAGLIGSK
jgi:hypothetical protein